MHRKSIKKLYISNKHFTLVIDLFLVIVDTVVEGVSIVHLNINIKIKVDKYHLKCF